MTPEQLTGKVSTHLVDTFIGQKSFLIHHQVVQDLLALKHAADQAGFTFNIASGFRDFERQMMIWNRKMSGQTAILDSNSQPLDTSLLSEKEKVLAILRWSALPGGSRHHWGCDFDVFDRHALPADSTLQLEPWEYLTGHQQAFYLWLKDNLADFGFFFPYQQDKGGVAPEPWHISHKQTAALCLEQLTLSTLQQQLESSSLIGQEVVLDSLETIYNRYITNISL
ncbi:D-alanyl-D-alanine carboxypeptidase family protein [Vibrio aquaticus]|uniref:D-alanyl-D-alanine carboxypeptidase family protein n=1 Tax=Vibrio aquaticus TaxID=2496559 RepID=A0A3S0QCY9_9VIBR|nr:M15 family metallopeptidase [Vibrio aquaticus]RTZ15472.1 D-alanyl-D-alanine carboxypeptidase family protein [Vibrio aquaticus]